MSKIHGQEAENLGHGIGLNFQLFQDNLWHSYEFAKVKCDASKRTHQSADCSSRPQQPSTLTSISCRELWLGQGAWQRSSILKSKPSVTLRGHGIQLHYTAKPFLLTIFFLWKVNRCLWWVCLSPSERNVASPTSKALPRAHWLLREWFTELDLTDKKPAGRGQHFISGIILLVKY